MVEKEFNLIEQFVLLYPNFKAFTSSPNKLVLKPTELLMFFENDFQALLFHVSNVVVFCVR